MQEDVLTKMREVALGPLGLAAGLAAALAGAVLGFGIMGYHAVADGASYTAVSWALIAPVWLGAALLWALGLRLSPFFFIALAAVATAGGYYYSDVYGAYPAAFLVVASLVYVLLTEPPRLEVGRGAALEERPE